MGMERKTAIALAAAALLSACANSPAQIKEGPIKAKYEFSASPEYAAKCTAAGLENMYSYMIASAHSYDNQAEVITRTKDLPLFVLSIEGNESKSTGILQFQYSVLSKDAFTDKVTEVITQCKGKRIE